MIIIKIDSKENNNQHLLILKNLKCLYLKGFRKIYLSSISNQSFKIYISEHASFKDDTDKINTFLKNQAFNSKTELSISGDENITFSTLSTHFLVFREDLVPAIFYIIDKLPFDQTLQIETKKQLLRLKRIKAENEAVKTNPINSKPQHGYILGHQPQRDSILNQFSQQSRKNMFSIASSDDITNFINNLRHNLSDMEKTINNSISNENLSADKIVLTELENLYVPHLPDINLEEFTEKNSTNSDITFNVDANQIRMNDASIVVL